MGSLNRLIRPGSRFSGRGLQWPQADRLSRDRLRQARRERYKPGHWRPCLRLLRQDRAGSRALPAGPAPCRAGMIRRAGMFRSAGKFRRAGMFCRADMDPGGACQAGAGQNRPRAALIFGRPRAVKSADGPPGRLRLRLFGARHSSAGSFSMGADGTSQVAPEPRRFA
jgi:hypothetical protein